MKIAKLYMLLAAGVAAMGMASCSTPDDPVMQKPTEFVLNTPPFAAQVYTLSEDGDIEFTCSQPDYGIGTVVSYVPEMSLTEDFANPVRQDNKNGQSATISVSQAKINQAILDGLGIVDEDTWAPYAADHVRPLYFRVVASVPGVEWSSITSNVIKLDAVDFFFSIKVPGYIYLVGSPEGWVGPTPENAEHYKAWRLFEPDNAIGSNIYSAVFDMPAAPMFRFYTELVSWNDNSFGSQVDDNPKDFELVDGSAEAPLVEGKGSFNFPNFEGGQMTVTVDMNNMTVKFEAGASKPVITSYVYMCGNMASSDWTEPSEANAAFYENWRLSCSDDSGVYTGTFDLANCGADNLYCRFYQELSGWGAAQWASPTDKDYPVEPGVACDTKVGEGCFEMVGAKGKKVSVSLDTTANKVTFTFVE